MSGAFPPERSTSLFRYNRFLIMGEFLFRAALILYIIGVIHSAAAFVTKRTAVVKVALAVVTAAFVFHTLFLVYRGVEKSFFPPVGLRDSLAFFAWAVTLCLLIAYARYRVRALGLFLLPLVTVLLLSTVFIKNSPIPEMLRSSWVYFHSTLLLLAYGMLFVAFVAAVLYLFQEKELKSKRLETFFDRLPSLQTLDELFQRFLLWGFFFMTAGLVVGTVWAEQQWEEGWHRDPKVIAASVTWGIYLILLYLRLTAGWRGKRAALMSLAGFLSILFTLLGVGYFGGLHKF